MTKLRISRDARADLRDIRAFSKERFGAAITKAYLNDMHATFSLLLERPRIGTLQSDLAPGVRAFSCRSHRIYFRIDGEVIAILRILHHAQSEALGSLA